MPFIVPSYDELLNEILTDYVNQLIHDPEKRKPRS